MSYCVYKHTVPDGRVYIGTCKNPVKRWNNGNGYKRNTYFYKAIQKYGWENIKHEILCEGLSKEEAYEKEAELITKYESNIFGYNRQSGGYKEGIEIHQYDQTGKLVNTFSSILKAAQETGINKNSICQVCKQCRQTAGGYVWRYAYDSYISRELQSIINSII